MANLDYNQQRHIMQFEAMLNGMGFYLAKAFDVTDKGGRFSKYGYKKNKHFGRYKYLALTRDGYPMIMYTFFSVTDKTGKVISEPETRYFQCEEKNNNKTHEKPNFDKAAFEKANKEKLYKEQELQKLLRKKAFKEYKSLIDVNADPSQHPYLIKKNVLAGRGLIICNKDVRIPSYYNQYKTNERDMDYYFLKKGDLLIPAINIDLEFVTYQRITERGVKLQRIDISTVGAFYCLGDWRTSTQRIYLCEGYATGYSLYNATNGVVFVCFDVHNMGVVLKQLKERFTQIECIVCTDNDRKKTTKVGLYKGFEYSYTYNSPFIFPVFPDEEKYSNDSDWNDLAKTLDYESIGKMCENQIKYFKEKGKNKCIELVAKKNGINGSDLKLYTKNNNLLFKTMDLSFK